MAKQVSKSLTSSKSKQNNKTSKKSYSSSSNVKNTVNNTTSGQMGWSSTTSQGGSRGYTYKDTSGLSPETIALQQRLYNDSGAYTPSSAVKEAQGLKDMAESKLNTLGKYQGTYDSRLSQTLDSILNRKPFEYDFNADALYKQYADNYEKKGRDAAANAAAQASALTGGYGNSYATSAAAQANEQYMTELNDKIPELYQLAAQRYDQDTQNLYNTYGAIGSADDRMFGRYQDERNALQTDRDYYGNNYQNERNSDMQAQQNAYDNAYNLLKYRTDLEARDVTDTSNWSGSNENSGSSSWNKEKGKQTTKQTDKTSEKGKSSSVDTSSSSQTTNTKNSGSGSSRNSSSKSKSGNKYTGTSTSATTLSAVMSEFKKKMTDVEPVSGVVGPQDQKKALKYLDGLVKKGTIQPEDFDYIVNVLDVRI